MLREVRLKKIWSSRIWACLCGRVVSKVYSPTLILTCLWASGRVLMKALGRHFFVLAENNAIGMAGGLHGIQKNMTSSLHCWQFIQAMTQISTWLNDMTAIHKMAHLTQICGLHVKMDSDYIEVKATSLPDGFKENAI